MGKVKTAEKILICATKLFAKHGYDGTIMDQLAEQSGVNKASIYYHHKDKITLYENTLVALFTPIVDTVIAAVDVEESAIKKLDVHIKTLTKMTAESPGFAAILMREMAAGGNNMPVKARKQMQRILALLKNTLQLGEDQAVFKSSDTLIIHFMIVGTINFFVSSIPFREALPKTEQYNVLKNTKSDLAAKQLSKTVIDSLLI